MSEEEGFGPEPCGSYHLVAGYVKKNLRCSGMVPGDDLDRLFPQTQPDYESSQLQNTLAQVVHLLIHKSTSDVEKVTAEKIEQIFYITDLESKDPIVISVFNDTLRAWLLDDQHVMCWERVLMVLAFTMSMIEQNIIQHKKKSINRILLLVGLCADFLDYFMASFINTAGGWSGFLLVSDNIMKQQVFDIPNTALRIEDVERSPGGTVYVNKAEVQQNTLLAEQKEKLDSSHVNYDLISAYVRENLAARNEIEDKVGYILPQILTILRAQETEYAQSEIIVAMVDVARWLMPCVAHKYHSVTACWNEQIRIMRDLCVAKHLVWKSFDIMMFSWLVQDNATPTWDRVIMVIEFTSDLVYSVAKRKGASQEVQLRRIYDLVHIATEFVNNYFHRWIQSQGGWAKLVDRKNYLTCTKVNNIPATAVAKMQDPASLKQYPDQRVLVPQPMTNEYKVMRREHLFRNPPKDGCCTDPILVPGLKKLRQNEMNKQDKKLYDRENLMRQKEDLIAMQKFAQENPQFCCEEYLPGYTGEDVNCDAVFAGDQKFGQIIAGNNVDLGYTRGPVAGNQQQLYELRGCKN